MTRVSLPSQLNTGIMYEEARDLVVSACLRILNASYRNLTKGEIDSFRGAIIAQRDSILFRFDALGFHVEELNSKLQQFEASASIPDPRRALLHSAGNTALMLLDDLVFNAASMFDYWAGLVACSFVGLRKRATKWNSLVNTVRGAIPKNAGPSEYFLRDSSTAIRSDQLHRDWVDALFSYRSSVIHFAAQKPNAAVVRYLTGERSPELKVHVPPGMVRKLGFLGEVGSQPELPILQGASHLYFACFQALTDLSLSFSSDVDDHFGRYDPFEELLTIQGKGPERTV